MVSVAFIIPNCKCFCLIFCSLNLQQADGALKEMQLLSSAVFSLGSRWCTDSKKVMGISSCCSRAVYVSMLIQVFKWTLLVRCYRHESGASQNTRMVIPLLLFHTGRNIKGG
jgi:hypothetical protein